MLSERLNLGATWYFFRKAIVSNDVPHKIAIDKSGANLAGAQAINTILKIAGTDKLIESYRSNTSTFLSRISVSSNRSSTTCWASKPFRQRQLQSLASMLLK